MKKLLAFICLIILSLSLLSGCKSGEYDKGVKLQEEGKYEEAVSVFEGIEDYEDYKDTAERIDDCNAMIAAIKKYDSSKKAADQKNANLDKAISEADALVKKGEKALDDTLFTKLETSISSAKAAKQTIPDIPSTEKEILSTVSKIDSIDYTKVLEELSSSQKALEKSIKQYALVNAPTEAYVIKCLETVEHIDGISAVTEDNDPNGNLNKAGGYTATVYFADDRVPADKVEFKGKTIIEKGTDGGGAIEVYANEEDVKKRNDYLAGFDGGILASGSHKVIGTVLVRTSDYLTASQQKELEAAIVDALTKVD